EDAARVGVVEESRESREGVSGAEPQQGGHRHRQAGRGHREAEDARSQYPGSRSRGEDCSWHGAFDGDRRRRLAPTKRPTTKTPTPKTSWELEVGSWEFRVGGTEGVPFGPPGRNMARHGKKFTAAAAQIGEKPYTIEEAIPLVQKVKYAKF